MVAMSVLNKAINHGSFFHQAAGAVRVVKSHEPACKKTEKVSEQVVFLGGEIALVAHWVWLSDSKPHTNKMRTSKTDG